MTTRRLQRRDTTVSRVSPQHDGFWLSDRLARHRERRAAAGFSGPDGRQRTIILGRCFMRPFPADVIDGPFRCGALLAMAGLGISVFKTAALALIGDVTASSREHTRFMNTIEGFFAVGAIVGPAIVAVLIGAGISWKWLYVVAAAICLGLVFMASAVRAPAPRATVERASATQMLTILRDPVALGFSLLVALYVAVEVAIYVWMPTYLAGYEGPNMWLQAWALTLFFVLRAVGRFVGAWLLDHVRWTVALVVMALMLFACFLGSLWGGLRVGVFLLPLSGLFMSIVYPTLNSKAISCFPKHRHGAAAGVILFFTALAAAAGPLAMAALSDARKDPSAGFQLATVFALLLLVGLVLNWWLDPARQRLLNADAPTGLAE